MRKTKQPAKPECDPQVVSDVMDLFKDALRPVVKALVIEYINDGGELETKIEDMVRDVLDGARI
jgi:hypothetical protein